MLMEITNTYVIIKCPKCNELIKIPRNHSDEGKYKKMCLKCGEKFDYEINLKELFGDVR